LKSSLRKSPIGGSDYLRQGADDDRFVDYAGAVQSIVTSAANNDSGLFETNLREERFLPFEGAGAESTWKLELPAHYPPFDYATISDVILHIRYTARQGVDPTKVKTALDEMFGPGASLNGANLALLFSLPHDFPTEWSAFVNGSGDLSIKIQRDYFPYFTHPKTINLSEFQFYGRDMSKQLGNGNKTELGDTDAVTVTAREGPVLTRTPGKEVFLIVRYSI
jgi:hypothetical protein